MKKKKPSATASAHMRAVTAAAVSRLTISGRKYSRSKPITLPKLKCLEGDER